MYKNRRARKNAGRRGKRGGEDAAGASAGPAGADPGLWARRAAAGLPLRADRSCVLGPARSDVPDRL